MSTAKDIMTANPSCVMTSDTVEMAAQKMRQENAGSLPVVEDQGSKRIVGIITDRDIAIRVVAEGKDPQTRVDAAMSRNPVTAQADDSVDKVARLMADQKVRRIPIVDGQDCVVGIVAQADLATRTRNEDRVANVVEEVSEDSRKHSQR
jgi:CBS domain-containing protein